MYFGSIRVLLGRGPGCTGAMGGDGGFDVAEVGLGLAVAGSFKNRLIIKIQVIVN